MSNTYDLICKDCKETYWFGQGSGDKAYMYKPEKLMQWMVKHSTCGEFAIVNNYAENYPKWYSFDEFKRVSYDGVDEEEE